MTRDASLLNMYLLYLDPWTFGVFDHVSPGTYLCLALSIGLRTQVLAGLQSENPTAVVSNGPISYIMLLKSRIPSIKFFD